MHSHGQGQRDLILELFFRAASLANPFGLCAGMSLASDHKLVRACASKAEEKELRTKNVASLAGAARKRQLALDSALNTEACFFKMCVQCEPCLVDSGRGFSMQACSDHASTSDSWLASSPGVSPVISFLFARLLSRKWRRTRAPSLATCSSRTLRQARPVLLVSLGHVVCEPL